MIEGGQRPVAFPQGGTFPAYGADALRFGLLAMSSAQDVRFSEEKVAQGQALANKLFNASRLVSRIAEGRAADAPRPAAIEDRWILSRLADARARCEECIERFELSRLALGLYDIVHRDLCDVYLELVKQRAPDDALAATATFALTETLLLAHPVIPFVTEAVWDRMPWTDGLLASASATDRPPLSRDFAAERTMDQVLAVVVAVRAWRDRVGVAPRRVLRARVLLDDVAAGLVARLARLELVVGEDGPAVATVHGDGVRVELLDEIVDRSLVAARASSERERLRAEIRRAELKLGDAGFVANAPQGLVRGEREKLARLRAELSAL